ncbi:MAG: ComEC/Rec2 family competence protein [Clostridia bacterium]|nr:ComEC/Rec2 family competence protein [Clostridia bacterium]
MRRPCVFFGAAFAAAAALAAYAHLSGALLFWLAASLAMLFAAAVLFCPRRVRSAVLLVLAGLSLAFLLTGVREITHRLPAEALVTPEGEFTATVLSYPEETSSGRLSAYTVQLSGSRLRAVLYTDSAEFLPGDTLTFTGSAERPTRDKNFDFDRYLRAKNIWLTLFSAKTPARISHTDSLRFLPIRISEGIRRRMCDALPGDAGGLLTGVMLGGRDSLSPVFSEAASRSGLSHMFAVSGMHLSVFAGMLLFLCRSRRAVFVLIPCCGFFAVMTGLSPSVLRAAFVLILPLLAPWFGRESDRLNTLFFALAVLLVANPAQIASLSLLYSFGAMLGLLLYGDRLRAYFVRPAENFPRPLRKIWGFFASGAAAYLAASLFSLPITAVTFRHLPVAGLAANVLLVWTLPPLFLGGYLVWLLLLLFPAQSLWISAAARPFPELVRQAVLFFGSGPSVGLGDTPLFVWFLLAYAGLILCLLLPPRRPNLLYAALASGGLCLALLISQPLSAGVTVDWLDVGSGQCVLLQCGRSTVMLDCGGDRPSEAAEDALFGANRRKIDLLVLSHTDADHSGGVAALLDKGLVRHLVLSDVAAGEDRGAELIARAAQAGCAVTVLSEDVRLSLPGAELTLFCADPPDSQPCITTLFSCGDTDIFFAADISAAGELSLLRRGKLPDLEILTVAHHGSAYSTSTQFLALAKPETAIISVGENRYGHPHPDTLSRLQAAGVAVRTTLSEGRIRLRLPT